jgi:cyclic lactone autoinducer peptide
VKNIKNLLLKAASSAAALILFVAVSSVGTTCFFTAYQPDVPEELR